MEQAQINRKNRKLRLVDGTFCYLSNYSCLTGITYQDLANTFVDHLRLKQPV